MMNISPSIGKILNRYGCDVTVKNGGKSVRTKAFIFTFEIQQQSEL